MCHAACSALTRLMSMPPSDASNGTNLSRVRFLAWCRRTCRPARRGSRRYSDDRYRSASAALVGKLVPSSRIIAIPPSTARGPGVPPPLDNNWFSGTLAWGVRLQGDTFYQHSNARSLPSSGSRRPRATHFVPRGALFGRGTMRGCRRL